MKCVGCKFWTWKFTYQLVILMVGEALLPLCSQSGQQWQGCQLLQCRGSPLAGLIGLPLVYIGKADIIFFMKAIIGTFVFVGLLP